MADIFEFKALFESSPGLYLVLRPDLTIAAVTDAYLAATMTRREAILDKHVFDIFPDNPNDPAATGQRNLTASLTRVLKYRAPDTMPVQKYDIRWPEAEGGMFEERYWTAVNSPIFDENDRLIYILHSVQDVTEIVLLERQGDRQLEENEALRRKAEQLGIELYAQTEEVIAANRKLQDANREFKQLYQVTKEQGIARLRAVVDYTAEGMITIDEKGVVQSFNRACERIFGYAPEEVIGNNVRMLMPEPNRSQHDNYLARYCSTGEGRIIGTVGREVEGMKKDGTLFPLELSISEIALEDQRIFSGILRDITERKQSEQRLERVVKELTESNTQLERFAYICSHDLQEPLRMIYNYTQRLAQHLSGRLDEKGKHYMDYIIDSTGHARTLISDVLSYARIGSEVTRSERIDCNKIVADVLVNLETAIQESGARITVDALPQLYGHATQFLQLFQNLLSNAIKFRSRQAPCVHIGAKDCGTSWEFFIRDNGIGIAPEYKDKVFIIFQRLARRGEYPGTGIGLAICKKIIEQQGGRIWLESQPEAGTTFFFTLPVITRGEEPADERLRKAG